MRTVTETDRKAALQQTTESHKGARAIATIWLVFYVLVVGIAITSPFIAIQFAAR